MELKFIEKGTILTINEATYGKVFDTTYRAAFNELVTEREFWAEGEELFHAFPDLREDLFLRISFLRFNSLFIFSGKALKTAVRSNNGTFLTLIERISGIESSSRREYPRHEITLNVRLFGLSESALNAGIFLRPRAGDKEEFSSLSFDISAGGISFVSNESLVSRFEPYFLAEFTLNSSDYFLLPAKLIRRGNCPQFVQYKYDYSFIFIYDNIPDEKNRLITAIFNAKLAAFNRL